MQLLLEALPVSEASELPDDFPYSFPELPRKDAAALADVASEFVQPGRAKNGSSEDIRSFEVRQVITVDSSGRRTLRKALFVDGEKADVKELDLA